MTRQAKELPLLIYDEECNMCRRIKEAIAHFDIDNVFHFRSLQDKELYKIFPQITPEDCQEEVHFIDEHGVVYKGSDVLPELMKRLPIISKIAWMFDNNAGKKALSLFYQEVQKRRFKKENGCKKCPKI